MSQLWPGCRKHRHRLCALLILVSAIPLLWPVIPPLTDLPGHMGRYRVELDQLAGRSSPYYAFHWRLVGNLGVDLLIIPMAKVFGLELGVKLIVMAIPMLMVTGMLWLAREIHGHIPPTILFALPLAYNRPFMFGFVNYGLAMALMLCALALWLRLARLEHYRLRALVFLGIAPGLWLCHVYGWGCLCLMAGLAELVHQAQRSRNIAATLRAAVIQCLVLTPPLLMMLLWRDEHGSGRVGGFFFWEGKLAWFREALRDQWPLFDIASVLVIVGIVGIATVSPWFRFSRKGLAITLGLAAAWLLLPYMLFGSAYADLRLSPYLILLTVVAIDLSPRAKPALARWIGLAGLLFFGVRTAATTVSFATIARAQNQALEALNAVPQGARLVSFVGYSCTQAWGGNRLDHLPALAFVRRHAFANDQWDLPGAQLLQSRYPVGDATVRYYHGDPSQMVMPAWCTDERWATPEQALANLPRDAFDYVWLIEPPTFDQRQLHGMTKLWANGPNVLYRIDHVANRDVKL